MKKVRGQKGLIFGTVKQKTEDILVPEKGIPLVRWERWGFDPFSFRPYKRDPFFLVGMALSKALRESPTTAPQGPPVGPPEGRLSPRSKQAIKLEVFLDGRVSNGTLPQMNGTCCWICRRQPPT